MKEYEEYEYRLKSSSDFTEFCIGFNCNKCKIFENEGSCEVSYDKEKLRFAAQYDFYIAAPFFNPIQIERVELVKSILKEKGYTFFSPKDDSAVSDINDPIQRKKVFALNHESIVRSKRVVAITDDKDPGTLWESGYAYAKDIPIIYIAFTLGKAPFNLMLSESAVATCKTIEELKEAIDGKEIYYEGDIE